jgi:hypothetical protein
LGCNKQSWYQSGINRPQTHDWRGGRWVRFLPGAPRNSKEIKGLGIAGPLFAFGVYLPFLAAFRSFYGRNMAEISGFQYKRIKLMIPVRVTSLAMQLVPR